MTLPTFRLNGIEAIDGFEGVELKSYDNNSVEFEIYGSKYFIRHSHSQLLLGSTTATIGGSLVRLKANEMKELGLGKASVRAQYSRIP